MKRAFRLSISRAALLGSLLSASPAFAHIDLLEPEARAHGTGGGADTAVDVNADQKNAPCGEATAAGRGTRITTYAPGETITVRVREEIPHDSYIRVVLDLDGEDFLARPQQSTVAETQEVALAAEEALGNELLLTVVRESNDTANFVHEVEVTLPNETCDNCTLQVIQFMYGAPDPFYHQCADLVIAEGGGSGSDAGAGGAPSAVGGSGGVATAGTGSSAAGAASVNRAGAGGSGGTPAVGSAGSASTAAAGSTQSGQAGSGNAPVGSDDDAEDEGGCTLTGPARGTAMPALFGLIALGLGGLVRRRRS